MPNDLATGSPEHDHKPSPAAPQPGNPQTTTEGGESYASAGPGAAMPLPPPPPDPSGPARAINRLSGAPQQQVVLQLQRQHGNTYVQRLVAQRLAMQQLVVQRENPPAPNDPDAARKQLEDDERKSYDVAKGKAGQVVAKVEYSAQKGQDKSEIETDEFKIAQFVEKPPNYPDKRVGFDNQGAASAFASTHAAGTGAVIVQQDKFFFVAKLAPSGHSLRAIQPTIGDGDWWKLKSTSVYQVIPQSGIIAVYSQEGMSFPLNKTIQPDVGSAKKLIDPTKEQAQPPSAADMRKMAGIPDDPTPENPKPGQALDKYGHPVGQIDIPTGTEEQFIMNYFRSRAMEMLNQNEAQAQALEKQFEPTNQGKEGAPGDIGPSAKSLIAQSRKDGEKYKSILDNEMKLSQQMSSLGRQSSLGGGGVGAEVTIGGKTQYAWQWKEQLDEKQKKVAEQKNELLAISPMLALLVPDMPPPSDMQQDFRAAEKKLSVLGLVTGAAPLSDLYGYLKGTRPEGGANPYDKSVLNEKPKDDDAKSKDQLDNKVGAEFRKKLDAVLQSLARAKAGVVGGDLDLLGMEGLRRRVTGDLEKIKGGNKYLKSTLDRMLADKSSSDLKWTILETVIQVGLIFVPGVGQLLSAVMGFALQAKEMDKHLAEWDVSKAAIDPATALVDQQKANETLFDDTLAMAVSAVDVATSVNGTLTAMEEGGKGLPKDKKGTEADEPHGKQANPLTPLEPSGKPKLDPWEADKLSPKLIEHFQSMGINAQTRQFSAGAVMKQSHNSWEAVKDNLLKLEGKLGKDVTTADRAAGQYFMNQMVEYRKAQVDAILEETMREIETARGLPKGTLQAQAPGSAKLTSDLDYTIIGEGAEQAVADFNAKFRQKFGSESGGVFDTNVYTSSAHLDHPIAPKDPLAPPVEINKFDPSRPQATGGKEAWSDFEKQTMGKAKSADDKARMRTILNEAEKQFPNDLGGRLRYVNNFEQDVSSHMAAADKFLSEGPEGAEKWAQYQKKVLDAAGERRNMMEKVLKEAEARAGHYQDEVLAKLNELYPGENFTREDLAKIAHGGASPEQTAKYEKYLKTRNRLYEQKLTELEELKNAYKKAGTEAEREALAAQINAKQSESLYFASESYQTGGSILSVVQNAQKAKGNAFDPAFGQLLAAQSRAAFFEQYGKAMGYGTDLEGTIKAGKYTERCGEAVRAHPNAMNAAMPGSVGTLKKVDAARQRGESVWPILKEAGYAGETEAASLAAFSEQLARDRDGLLKTMSEASGKPIPGTAEEWEKLAQVRGMTVPQLMLKMAAAVDTASRRSD